MANPDGIHGIGGDREFMNYLYLYYKKKQDLLKDANKPKDELKKQECELYVDYLKAIEHCLLKIRDLEKFDSQHFYLDWLRWNIDVVHNELLHFEGINMEEDRKQCIDTVNAAILQIFHTHFQLTEVEKAISNQYVHMYQLISRSGHLKSKVIINAGKIFINYVNLLKERYYIDRLDRADVTFAQLNAEADFLVEKLKESNMDPCLAKQIEEMKDMYEQFRLMDDVLRKKDDENIKIGLELAHQRATESFIQSVKRNMNEAISQLKQKLIEKMNRAWEAAIIVLNPLMSVKSLANFIMHPIDSIVGVIEWAKENPWKCAGLVLGGLAIGVGVGVTYASAATSGSLVVSSVVGGIGGALLPMSFVGGNMVEWKKEENRAKQEMELMRKKNYGTLEIYKEEGKLIANKHRIEEEKREFLKRNNASYEHFLRLQEEEQRLSGVRERQLESMSPEELDETQRKLLEYVKQLEEELQRTQEALRQSQNDASRKQSDIVKVNEAKDALYRLMHNTYEQTSV